MTDKTVYQLEDIYQRRIYGLAMLRIDNVLLTARSTSGKTLTLFVTVPGLRPLQKAVLRMHRKEHKRFWQVVKAATDWLTSMKLVKMLADLSRGLPKAIIARKLANAAVKAEKAKVAAAGAKGIANSWESYYHPERNVYDLGMRRAMLDLLAEKGRL